MAKPLVKDDVISNKKQAVREINNLLELYINEPSGDFLKKANLISYWLKDYARYIRNEDSFDPKRNISYKRGNIVKISFGFNVGKEYGGLHYGIVLDNNNHHNSPVVTVIPLTSIKDTTTVHSNSVDLGNEIYRALKIKHDTLQQSLKNEQEDILTSKKAFSLLLDSAQERLDNVDDMDEDVQDSEMDEIEKLINECVRLRDMWQEKEIHNATEQKRLAKIGAEIAGMKQGSIALVNQITTVSKMRIFDPKKASGVLSGISLSAEAMDKINEKVKELYIFK